MPAVLLPAASCSDPTSRESRAERRSRERWSVGSGTCHDRRAARFPRCASPLRRSDPRVVLQNGRGGAQRRGWRGGGATPCKGEDRRVDVLKDRPNQRRRCLSLSRRLTHRAREQIQLAHNLAHGVVPRRGARANGIVLLENRGDQNGERDASLRRG